MTTALNNDDRPLTAEELLLVRNHHKLSPKLRARLNFYMGKLERQEPLDLCEQHEASFMLRCVFQGTLYHGEEVYPDYIDEIPPYKQPTGY